MTDREQLELEEHWSALYGAGAERTRAYHAAGRPSADRGALCIVGDREIVEVVRAVLAKLPESVAHYVVGTAIVVCGGVSTRGWVGEMPTPPCDAPHLVALADADAGVIAHELAHVWHRPRLPPAARLTAAELEGLRAAVCALAVDDGTIHELRDELFEHERAADALATAWGFRVDTVTGCRGERRRRGLMLDIQRRGGGS